MVTLTGLLASLPPEPNEASLFAEIQQEVAGSQCKLVVIDDDPTGTQTVHDIESSLTDPTQAHEFITTTGAAMLAVSIGNVHGHVPVSPSLDFERLAQIAAQVDVPLVLHGASGIPREDIQHAIHMGIAKLNINTEVRMAFLRAIAGWGVRIGPEPDLRKKGQDLLDLMQEAMAAAQGVVEQTIRTCNFLLNAHD